MTLFQIIQVTILVCLLAACQNNSAEVTTQQSNHVVLIDSVEKKAATCEYPNHAYYLVFYLGEKSDTIRLGKNPISYRYNEARDAKYDTATNWAKPTPANLEIFVDTAAHLTHKEMFLFDNEDDTSNSQDSIEYFDAFPVWITNHSDSLLMVGSHNMLRRVIREKQDKSGQWVEVEKPVGSTCGTGARNVVIEPNGLVLAKLLRYKGNHKSIYRLKFKLGECVVFSNQFEDFDPQLK